MAETAGETSNALHRDSDVDSTAVAQHHTLGPGPTQAAAGNHNHDQIYSEKTHTHDDLAQGTHQHMLNTLSDVELNVPENNQVLAYQTNGIWTNKAVPYSQHALINTTPPTPRGPGDLWVDTSAYLLEWDDAWNSALLLNNWSYDSTFGTPGYRKFPGSLVLLRGVLKNGSAGSVFFVLPVGYRPSVRKSLTARVNPNVPGDIYVEPNGDVSCVGWGSGGSPNVWTAIDGLIFNAEQ